MARDFRCLFNRYHWAGVFILLVGLVTATWIYVAADTTSESPDDAALHVVVPGESKAYRHELERFGGKAAVMADDLNRWFVSLWQGKRLAVLIGLLTVVVAVVCFRVGARRQGEGADDPGT